MQQHPGHYAQLLTTSNEPVDLEIMRDLNRTFPNHVFFHQRQGPGQQSLFHVLRAYSAHDRQVGSKGPCLSCRMCCVLLLPGLHGPFADRGTW